MTEPRKADKAKEQLRAVIQLLLKAGYDEDRIFNWFNESYPEDSDTLKRIGKALGLDKDDLFSNFDDYISDLVKEEAADFFGNYRQLEGFKFPAGVKEQLLQYTSPDDLAERILRLGYTKDIGQNIYNSIIRGQDDADVNRRPDVIQRAAQARIGKEESKYQQTIKQANYRTALENIGGQNAFNQATERYGNRFVTPEEQATIEALRSNETYGQPQQLGQYLGSLAPQIEQRARAEQRAGDQRNLAVLNAFAGEGPARQGRVIGGPAPQEFVPDAGGMTRQALTEFETGLESFAAPGTRLREMVESEVPDILRSTSDERRKWWESVSQPRETTSRGAQPRDYQAEAERLLGLSQTLPTDTVLGGTYWGEGGPAATARATYESVLREQQGQQGLRDSGIGVMLPGQLSNEGFEGSAQRGSRPTDPMQGLRSRLLGLLDPSRVQGYRERINRRPGVATSARLAPRVRYG